LTPEASAILRTMSLSRENAGSSVTSRAPLLINTGDMSHWKSQNRGSPTARVHSGNASTDIMT